MESSGEQALIIGVNVFILVIALTCAIMLMTTVLSMSTAANTTIKTTMNSSLMTLYGGTNERVYTGEQVLAILEEYLSPTSNVKDKYLIKIGGVIMNEETSEVTFFTKKMLDANYSLGYDKQGSKIVYIFEEIEEEEASEG